MTTYWQKLKDPRWQRKRLEALERQDFHCEICGDGEATLHVHHKVYFKGLEPWEYDIEQLAVLCESCHESVHDFEDPYETVGSYLPLDGPRSRRDAAVLVLAAMMPDQEVVAGFIGRLFPHEWPYLKYQIAFGRIAAAIEDIEGYRMRVPQVLRLADAILDNPERFESFVREFVDTFEKKAP